MRSVAIAARVAVSFLRRKVMVAIGMQALHIVVGGSLAPRVWHQQRPRSPCSRSRAVRPRDAQNGGELTQITLVSVSPGLR